MFSVGIIGLPNIGKSTLFNAITNSKALAANFPFATIEPNKKIVYVQDQRLDLLSKIFPKAKKIAANIEIIDIAGLVKGASKGEGLGNQFLDNIRKTQAVIHVVRCFEDQNIKHVEDKVDPVSDVQTIETELKLADLTFLEKQKQKLLKKKKAFDNHLIIQVIDKIISEINQHFSFSLVSFNEQEREIIKNFHLFALKPRLFLANVAENDLNNLMNNQHFQKLNFFLKKQKLISVSAKLEEELNHIPEKEKRIFLQEYGLKTSILPVVIQQAYALLNLGTFFTAGPKEIKAWSFLKGKNAQQTAGIIHSDFAKGFIKAEVIKMVDVEKYHNFALIKEKGKVSLEGKNYLVQDGDIITFRFNV